MGASGSRSIAFHAARRLAGEGAEIVLSCQDEALAARVGEDAEGISDSPPVACDVAREGAVEELVEGLRGRWPEGFDFALHSLAFAPRESLSGPYMRVSAEAFSRAMLVSCFSLTELARAARPALRPGAALLTLTYLGSSRTVPGYNAMGVAKAALEASVRYLAADLGPDGVRVNALRAGPVRTASGAAIADARHIFAWSARSSHLGANPDADAVARAALYLLSPLSAGVTGEVLNVDGGLHSVGVPAP